MDTLKTMPAWTGVVFLAFSRQEESRNSRPMPKPMDLGSLLASSSWPLSWNHPPKPH